MRLPLTGAFYKGVKMLIVIGSARFGCLGWWPDFAEVILPVEETIGYGGGVKPNPEETVATKGAGQFPYLNQTLRRTIGGYGLTSNTSQSSFPR